MELSPTVIDTAVTVFGTGGAVWAAIRADLRHMHERLADLTEDFKQIDERLREVEIKTFSRSKETRP